MLNWTLKKILSQIIEWILCQFCQYYNYNVWTVSYIIYMHYNNSLQTMEKKKIVLCIQGAGHLLHPVFKLLSRSARPNSGVLKYEWNIERDVIFAVSWQAWSASIVSKNRNTRNLQYESDCRISFRSEVPSMRNVRRRRDKQNNSGVYCCSDGSFADERSSPRNGVPAKRSAAHNSRWTPHTYVPAWIDDFSSSTSLSFT